MGKKSFKKRVNVFNGESNPFNVKVNREKHYILGQKTKGTKGLPVISRGESHEKRKQLWQKTKVKFHKANHFVDKRQMDGSTTAEEIIANRLVKERKRKLKKNIFNLNETEELTHLGQSLQDIKSFDDKGSASEDDEPLNADYVKEAHFGGFEVDHKEQPKSHKEIIQQLILDSKIKKHEMKTEREVTVNLTQKLDQDWKDMLTIIAGIKANGPTAPEKNDPYDILAKELMFEKKAAPSKRIKSKEELEKEEQERLDKLEQERRVRQLDESETKPRKASDHMSADSLCDDFDFEKNYNNIEAPVEVSAPLSESEYSDSDESVDSQESEQLNETPVGTNLEPGQNETSFEGENTSGIPLTLEEFEDLISSCSDSPDEISNVIEGILKDKLRTKSKNLLSKFDVFFGILMEYAVKCLESNIKITEILPVYLHALAEASPLNTALKFLPYLDKEYKELKSQKKRTNFPGLKTMLILKYCSVLYSVSDFRHPVVTPAMVFMSDILSSACFLTFQTIASRLLVCSVISDCVSQSKCFVPEAVYFLHKVLKLADLDPNSSSKTKKKDIDLVLVKKSIRIKTEEINLLDLIGSGNTECSDAKKLGLISEVVHLLQKFSLLYRDLPSYLELFSPILATCSELSIDWYPTDLQASIQNLKQSLQSKPSPLSYLVYHNTKPKPLKLFEPSFESKFSDKDDINKKFKMIKKVSQNIRKEEKGLLREMRRDVQMIAAEKLRETLESDAERKRKVKELYHDLAVQEGEFKKMMKKKP